MRAKDTLSLVGVNLDGRGAVTPGILLVAALLSGALLAGCGSGEEAAGGAPPPEEETRVGAPATTAPEAPEEGQRDAVVIRVSGTPGTAFAGSYGNLDETQNADYTVLEGEPVEYEVDVRDSGFDAVSASFVKAEPDDGTVEVEILVDGEVVAEKATSFQYATMTVNWSFGG